MFNVKSKEIKQILLYFFINEEKKLYASELSEKLGLDPSNTLKSLNKIIKEGIFLKEKRGGHWFYFLNANYPMLNEVRKIFLFKYGLAEILKKELKGVKGIEEAYIYGSYAKDELEAESDIDLLIIGSHSSMELVDTIIKLQDKYGREFNNVNMTRKELENCKKKKDEFITDIFQNTIIKVI